MRSTDRSYWRRDHRGKAEGRESHNRPSHNAAAHLTYLKGRYLWNKRTEQDLNRSIDAFNDALQIAPDFALAHLGPADAWILRGIWSLEPPEPAFGAARNAAERALQIDGNLAEAHTCRAEAMKD